jgi:preprotein translocase subunit SecG
MLHSVLLTLHVLVAVGLIVLVMLQHGRGADAGAAFGSGGSGTVFGARGAGGFLTKATAVLATLFFVISLSLAYLTTRAIESTSVVERVGTQVSEDAPNDLPNVPTGANGSSGASDVPDVPKSTNN